MKNIALASKNDFLLEHGLKEELGKAIHSWMKGLICTDSHFQRSLFCLCAKPRPPEGKQFSVGFSPSAADCPIPSFNWQFPQVLVDA